jgi:hypothetical protein
MARVRIPTRPGQVVDMAGSGSLARRGTTLGFLLALLFAIDGIRRGWPWEVENGHRRVIGYAGAVFIFGVAAVIAPEFATLLLVGVVAISFIRALPAIQAWLERVTAALDAPAGHRAAGGARAI